MELLLFSIASPLFLLRHILYFIIVELKGLLSHIIINKYDLQYRYYQLVMGPGIVSIDGKKVTFPLYLKIQQNGGRFTFNPCPNRKELGSLAQKIWLSP